MRLTFGRSEDDPTQPAVAVRVPAPVPPPTLAGRVGEPTLAEDQRALAARVVSLMRGPLAHASGVLDAMLGAGPGELPGLAATHLGGVAEDTRRLRKAVEDLDALVRLEPHDVGDVRLMIADDWLRRAVDLHRERADARGTRLELHAPEEGLLVRGVPDALDDALFQLLDNAINATRAGGTVSVDAAADGQRLLIRVRDDGIGFDAQDAPHLTACFTRSRAATAANLPGLGVGLFLANRIARQHGGLVELRGETGGGATVWLELPQA